MKKRVNLGKNSFSLLETIISITIISILVGGFLYSSSYSKSSNVNIQKRLEELNKTDTVPSFITYNIISQTSSKSFTNNQIKVQTYNKELFLQKYSIQEKKIDLNYKDFK